MSPKNWNAALDARLGVMYTGNPVEVLNWLKDDFNRRTVKWVRIGMTARVVSVEDYMAEAANRANTPVEKRLAKKGEMMEKRLRLADILSDDKYAKRNAGLPHVTPEQIENLRALLTEDVSLYEEFHTLVLCGLEEYGSGGADRHEVSEKIATCLLLVVKGVL